MGENNKNHKKYKKNKNSIIRVIISNFDDKSIKEIKILYLKNGLVDTFDVNSEIISNDSDKNFLIFNTVKHRNNIRGSIEPVIEIDKENRQFFIVRKKDKYSGDIFSEYKISGEVSKTNDNVFLVKLNVNDITENEELLKNPRRRIKSSTERKLLKSNLMENYSKIIQCSQNDIDSLSIYKANRFLSYRSNFLIYFNFINELMTKGLASNQIYKNLKNDELDTENVDNIIKNFQSIITQKINDYNIVVQNHNDKIERKRQENKNNKSEKKNKCLKRLNFIYGSKDVSESPKLREDIKNIYYIFTDFRHKIMHYNYRFFDELYSGKECFINVEKSEKNLSELLDLNLFKEFKNITDLRRKDFTNYLDDKTEIDVLAKNKKAEKLYNIYNELCRKKNGFNNFINSFFFENGIEKNDVKELLQEKCDDYEKDLKKNAGKEENINEGLIKYLKVIDDKLQKYRSTKAKIGDFYVWDIYSNKNFKVLSSERQKLVAEQSDLISKNNPELKNRITEINKELLRLKKEMKDITEKNSISRLEIRMQIAFGFLNEKYDLDIKKFLRKFDTNNVEVIKEFKTRENLKIYINSKYKTPENKRDNKFDFNYLEREVFSNDIKFLENSKSNNLVKFYILSYLLLPKEIRGDFLGYAKKHYYDIKNVDFVAEPYLDDLDNNNDEEKNNFFHNIRLFEKNIKKFEVINYDMSYFMIINDNVYKNLGIDTENTNIIQYTGNKQKRLFDTNIILPVFKFYQILFKLINDIEIHLLFRYMKDKGIDNIENAIKDNKRGKFFNFRVLIDKILKTDNNFLIEVRNNIDHLDFKNIFAFLEKGNDFLNRKIDDNIINTIMKFRLEYNDGEKSKDKILEFSFINDFYMKKEKFLFNLKKNQDEKIDTDTSEEKDDKEKKLLERNNISIEKIKNFDKEELNKTFNRFIKISEILNNLKDKTNRDELIKLCPDLEIFISKNKQEKLSLLSKPENHIEKISGRASREASDLLGVYKKYFIFNIKKKLINFFTKGERKILRVYVISKEKDDKNNEFFKPIIFERNIIEHSDKEFHENEFRPVYKFESGEEFENKMKEYGLDFYINENCLECKINNNKMKIVSKEKREIKEAENKDKNSEKKECENRKEIRNIAGKYIFNYRIFSN